MAQAIDPSRRIETGRLVITNWRPILADPIRRPALENALEKMLTPSITKRLPLEMDFPGTYAAIADWIGDRDKEEEIWCAHARADGRLMGLGMLFGDDEQAQARIPVIMIGYFLGEREWGKGFGKEFVGSLVAAIEKTAPVHISAKVDGDNTASARLLESLGFIASDELSTPDRFHFDKICT
jgi:RimJ/RimL family protein N-acetyltransferase